MYKNTNDINDTEYRRMRKAEDSSYEYHGEEDDEAKLHASETVSNFV